MMGGLEGLGGGVTELDEPTMGRPERQWGRTARTRENILEAALEIFLAQGYADTAVAQVVERSGSSVGSIYHHFGGKAELYLSLYERHQNAYVEAVAKAVRRARSAGEEDLVELFLVGSRAFLETAWKNRAPARMFLTGDGPPGFPTMQRRGMKDWIRQNAQLLKIPDNPANRVKITVLTGMIDSGTREVTSTESRREAKLFVEATLRLVRAVTVTDV